jgi:flavodoxin/ferredoxin
LWYKDIKSFIDGYFRGKAVRFISLLLGRRQFLIAFIGSALVLVFNRLGKAFNLLFQSGPAQASNNPSISHRKNPKGIVVYYSATGSTGKIAGAIHRGMKSIIECYVAPIKKIDPKEMDRYDVIAVGGPIWYYRETANLRQFLYNMPHMAGKLCITFCTHGSQPDGFFFSIAQPLFKKALTIIGWNDWYGACSHVLHMPKPYHTDGHPDEIDLQEAEAFGREMAERAVRIIAGERNLIPDIPTGPDADPLWIDHNRSSAGMMPGGPDDKFGPVSYATETVPTGTGGEGLEGGPRGGGGPPPGPETPPEIDISKCVYPRCTACIENCLKNAIDLSVKAPSKKISGSPILVKEACILCPHPLCQRSCYYDAIIYDSSRTEHIIHMDKCTYPKCTLCIDHCPMDAIDFSQDPPVFSITCEGCDLCWCICPVDAIEITNIADTHARLGGGGNESFFFDNLRKAEATGKFRRLVPLNEIGWDNIVYKNPNAPRVVLIPEDYPYDVKK